MSRYHRLSLTVAVLAIAVPALAGNELEEVIPDAPVALEEALFHPPTRLTTAQGVIDSGASWGHSGPWIADVDGDSLLDLVVGDFSGLFRFYRNRGSNSEPRYAEAVNLQAEGTDAKVPIY